MAAFALTFLLQCLFPIFDLNSSEFLGLSLVNTDTQQREFTVTVRSPEGTGTQAGSLTIPAGAQRARLVREILATSTNPANGWMRVDGGAGPACTGYVLQGNDESFAGLEPAPASASTELLLPHIEINTGFMELNHADTLMAVVNPGSTAASVSAGLFALAGTLRGTVAVQVPAQGSRIFRVSELFANVLPGNNVGGKTFQGYIRLTSNVGIAAWQRIDTPLSMAPLRGRAPAELNATSLAMFPHYVFGGDYGSVFNLVNPGTSPVTLELSAHGDRGNLMGEAVRITLAPGEGLRAAVGDFFRVPVIQIFPPPNITGHIRIREVQGQSFQIAGSIQVFRTTNGAPLAAVLGWVTDRASMDWTLPFVSTVTPYFSGYVVANPNELLTVQTDVTVDVVDSAGAVVNRTTHSLSPKNRQVVILQDGLAGGYIRVRANFPVHVIGSIGTRDGHALDYLP